ncbi:MAG: iron-containing alcohol dehydrogenase [Actinomycetota bacterium]|nr:iron-containing alcohol dehydrogenase [Actinomycetota bacterium]
MKFRLDPTDLQALYAEVGQPLRLSRVACRAEALNVLPEMLHGWPQVLIVEDDTDMRRGDNDLKPLVHQLLEGHGFEVAVVELRGSEGEALSTTPQHISRVVGELRSGQAVLALGSGTITDITKHAVYLYESEPGRSPPLLVGVPTANSVVAYASSLAVVLKGGVKRTLPSRLPDALVLDTQTLGDAPYAYRLGGVGDCSVVMTSFADLYLASVTGMGRWSDTSWEVVQDLRVLFLGRSPTLADRGIVGAEVLGKAITLGGIAMTYAGESAPLSGYEHVISHMLDMSARHFGRPVGNHGSQCGLGTMLTAVAYQRLLADCGRVGSTSMRATPVKRRCRLG